VSVKEVQVFNDQDLELNSILKVIQGFMVIQILG
jgi:hypothetical protein